ncbi:hypothetical protein ABFG95_05905 [Achromobacter sp. HNDS-1]|uniref:Uncharacterized protein n=1 Tax=Achromobacter sp. HNDS-1 TaxID=3151598 RepID=A0AAU7LDJ9_9BURK|nr:hypothetical protein [Achromobacter ruhlandii]MCI1839176.1 hypothetical protein [Achromobacter ruhlandii]
MKRNAEDFDRCPTGDEVFVRQPRRVRQWIQRGVLCLVVVSVLACVAAYGTLILQLAADSMRSKENQLASWMQGLIAVGTFGITTILLWLQVQGQVASREEEVDDGLYRTVASFALIADRLVAYIKEGRTDAYANDVHDQPHFLLAQLQEAPFYAFPNGKTLAHAISIADQLSRILQRRSLAATIVAKHEANDQVHLHQAIKAIEGELHLLRIAAVNWAPTYKGWRIRRSLARALHPAIGRK